MIVRVLYAHIGEAMATHYVRLTLPFDFTPPRGLMGSRPDGSWFEDPNVAFFLIDEDKDNLFDLPEEDENDYTQGIIPAPTLEYQEEPKLDKDIAGDPDSWSQYYSVVPNPDANPLTEPTQAAEDFVDAMYDYTGFVSGMKPKATPTHVRKSDRALLWHCQGNVYEINTGTPVELSPDEVEPYKA